MTERSLQQKENDDTPGSNWRIWRTATHLEENGLSSPLHQSVHCQKLTKRVVSILRRWGRDWAGISEWQSFLNKSSLLHEVEESIVALNSLLAWMRESSLQESVTVVDVCCGKGVFSMLCSYLFEGDGCVKQLVMLDKAPINWNHVTVANTTCESDKRPCIHMWAGCDLYQHDAVLDRLESLQGPLAMVGIHLCKSLGPACVGLVNGLGTTKCPFLCLAPCCLPRLAITKSKKKKRAKVIQIPLYELPDERRSRCDAMQRREEALGRGRICSLCRSSDHRVRDCSLLPEDETKRIAMLQEAAQSVPCWRCGVVGHFKADCPTVQSSSKPIRITPPMSNMDVSTVLESDRPFDTYCDLLTETLQRDKVRLVETGLINNDVQHDQSDNWNSGRKSIYIVAT